MFKRLILASFFEWGVLNSFSKDIIDLSGKWQFSEDSHNVGVERQWYNQNFTNFTSLPGSMALNGLGYAPGPNTNWTGTVTKPDFLTDPANDRYVNGDVFKVPFWFVPEKYYVGPAWYAKEIEAGKSKEIRAICQLGDSVSLWDEFSPELYTMRAALVTGKRCTHLKSVRFGMREFASQGRRFTVNGRPIMLRGTLECAIFPLTGYPSMDVDAWMKIFRKCRDFGMNHMRFHSWCPPEAAFTAAITGVCILQVPARTQPFRINQFLECKCHCINKSISWENTKTIYDEKYCKIKSDDAHYVAEYRQYIGSECIRGLRCHL